MTRRIFCLLLVLLLPLGLAMAAQEAESHGEHGEGGHGAVDHGKVDLWKTINFAILAAILGWATVKFGGKYFRGRAEKIRQGIDDAKQVRAEAEARAAEIERRIANLDADVEELRRQAKGEMAAEEARLKAESERTIARLRANAEQSIASASKHARKELRVFASELALRLARQKIVERMDAGADATLIDSFVEGLEQVQRRVN